jgi:vacuolar-type H+-ATPase subunit H
MLEARRILSEEGEVLGRAEAEGQEMIQRAERQAAFILDQSQLIKVAEARAQETMESAEKEAAQVLHRAERDARDVYLGLERELDLLLRDIKELVAARLSKLRR